MRTYFTDVSNWRESPKPPKHKLCCTLQTGDVPVTLAQHAKDNFAVVYGKQVKEGLSYEEACTELGACVMHALACGGRLDNR